jgi:hypothetical protein
MTLIENVVANLKTYSGRDSCIRVVAYFSLFLHGVFNLIDENKKTSNNNDPIASSILLNLFVNKFLLYIVSIESAHSLSISFKILSKQFATTRLILRFFDDIPAIYNFYVYINKIKSISTNNKPSKKDENNNIDEKKQSKNQVSKIYV